MRWILLPVLFVLSQAALADQLYVFVAVKCTRTHVEVKFERAWNEAGESMLAAPVPNRWNTENLRSISSDDDVHYHTTPRPKTIACKISGTNIRVVVRPAFAPRWHPVGRCAARTGATVEIYRARYLLLEEGLDACTEEGDVPVSIVVAASGRPVVVRMPAFNFINES